ncbi:MAG: O-acetyl-ADP-ribose deacetylase [Ignavibacteriaceae bacterium]
METSLRDRTEIFRGDITKLKVDAIVNAANSSLLGGGGVDGAIHDATGPELLEYCRKLNGCPTGEAKITPGFKLPAKFVIHTVGPVWRGGIQNEAKLLESCYKNSLDLAVENRIKTIAIPAISTGIYGYPLYDTARIAVNATLEFLKNNSSIEKVIFVCFDEKACRVYSKLIQEI